MRYSASATPTTMRGEGSYRGMTGGPRSIGTSPDGAAQSVPPAIRPRYDQKRRGTTGDMVILGIVLVLVGAGLLVAEAHLPTYGALGIAGVVSLVLGGAIAVDASGGGVALVLSLVAGVALAVAVRGVVSVSRRRSRTGAEALVGQVGVVRNVLEPVG